ncbi:hypothetical protein [Streptomyces sp. NPDC090022]|uniref:hypothetical protein n=1 Tax=Streptomyces sp. NPDC090022 TaxID=3365920 RepID=UPI00382A3856
MPRRAGTAASVPGRGESSSPRRRSTAARRSGCRFLSSAAVRDVPGRGPESPGRPDARLEALIAASGAPHTFLRPHGFISNTLRWAEAVRSTGVVRAFGGEACLNLIDERDIAAVAVHALIEDGHDGRAYDLTGPSSPSQSEQLRTLADVLGRPLRWHELPRPTARAEMLAAGWPNAVADGALRFMADHIGRPEQVTDTVLRVTGRPPRSFRDWLADHAVLFRE